MFTLSESQSVTIGDGTMIPGWDEALKTMAVGEQVRMSSSTCFSLLGDEFGQLRCSIYDIPIGDL